MQNHSIADLLLQLRLKIASRIIPIASNTIQEAMKVHGTEPILASGMKIQSKSIFETWQICDEEIQKILESIENDTRRTN